MRISPINLICTRTASIKRPERKSQDVNTSMLAPMKADTVCFSGAVWDPRVSSLRALLEYKIPDLYSDVILIPSEKLKSYLSKDVFSGSVGDVVRILRQNKESLFPVEAEFYSLLRAQQRKNPNMALNKFVKTLVPEYHGKLLKTQQDVFDRLDLYAKSFPADLLEQYNYLSYVTDRKLHNKQQFIPFSVKEFRYKLKRINDRILYSGNEAEIQAMNKLMSIAGIVPDVSKELRMDKKFKSKKYEQKQIVMIERLKNSFAKSVLRNDKDILEVLKMAEDRIYKCPTLIPFNRKTYIHDIQEITSRLEDKRLAHLVEVEASSLPTSKENLAAFVVKEAERSSEQIVFDMLSGSVGSIDHLVALHRGGKDSLYNYVLSSSYMNGLKAHMPVGTFIQKHPEISRTAQKHINRLETLEKNGVFEEVGLEKFYIENLINKLNKLASKKIIQDKV